jgi:hypothetical protein
MIIQLLSIVINCEQPVVQPDNFLQVYFRIRRCDDDNRTDVSKFGKAYSKQIAIRRTRTNDVSMIWEVDEISMTAAITPVEAQA